MVNICPHCGSPCEVPFFFKVKQQRIFRLVWENPGVTVRELAMEMGTGPDVIWQHLCQIRKGLRHTDYQLSHIEHWFPRRYRIIMRQKKGHDDASTNITTSL